MDKCRYFPATPINKKFVYFLSLLLFMDNNFYGGFSVTEILTIVNNIDGAL